MSTRPRNSDDLPPSELLDRKIRGLQKRKLAVEAGSGGTLAATVFLLLIGVEAFVDWRLELPWALRLIWFLTGLGIVLHLLNERVVIPFLDRIDTDRAALLVEKHFPVFNSRLISALQLTRPGALHGAEAAGLVSALVRQTEQEAEKVDFNSIVRTNSLRRRVCWLLGIIAVAGVCFGLGGNVSTALLQRAFLSTSVEVPRKTRVSDFSGDLVVGRGDPVVITATATGVVPAEGSVEIEYDSGLDRAFTMERTTGADTYTRRLESVQESFDYLVRLNDGRSRPARVEVVPRPSVAGLEARQVFPAYTGLEDRRRTAADLALLAGSRLQLAVTANKQVTNGWLQLHGTTNRVPLQLGANPTELRGTIDIIATNLIGFSVHMADVHGLESRDEAVYRVDVLPDRVPEARITYPLRREELATRTARMMIAFEATDDFAIAEANLRYRIDDGDTNTIPLDLPSGDRRFMKNRYNWDLTEITPPLTEDASVHYWLEIVDNNNVTGPGRVSTDLNVVRIVSEEEKRNDLMNRVGDSLGSIGDAATDQESLNQRLGELIRRRTEESIGSSPR